MDLAIFCNGLSAMGPPCVPLQPENFRAQLLTAMHALRGSPSTPI